MIRKDTFKTGLLFVLVAGFFIYQTLNKYSIGTAEDMGPGYFPLIFSSILGALGLWLLISSWRSEDQDQSEVDGLKQKKNILLILSGIVAFGLLLMSSGFLIASAVLLGTTAVACPRMSLRSWLIFFTTLVLFSYFVFSRALDLYFPLFPPWIF